MTTAQRTSFVPTGISGMTVYDTTSQSYWYWDGTANVWREIPNTTDITQNTLDQAYDEGGAGAGRTITADAGAVNITGADGLTVNGNVGIGTTGPLQKLEVIGNISLPSNSGNKSIYTWAASDANWRIGMSASPGFTRALLTSHVQYLTFANGAGQGFALGDNVTGLSAFEVGSSGNGYNAYFRGNVGVGTAAPTQKLQVNVSNNGVNIPIFIRNQNGTQTGGNGVGIGFTSEVNDANAVPKAALFHERTTNYGVGKLHFLVNSDNASNTSVAMSDAKMTILPDGNVGIGITSPSARLQVEGTSSSASAGTFIIGNTGSTNLRMGYVTSDHTWIQSHGSTPLYINELGNNTIINSGSGNLGVGITSPAQKLHVVGNVRVSGLSSGGNVQANANGDLIISNDIPGGDGDYIQNQTSTAQSGAGFYTAGSGRTNGTMTAGGSTVISSDNIQINDLGSGNRYAYLDLEGDGTYTDYGLRLIRHNGGANTTSQLLHRGTGDLNFQTQEASAMTFSTSSSERMRITSVGNVGIGLTNPGAKLTVRTGSTDPSTYDDGKALFVSGSFNSGQAADGGVEFRHDNLSQGIGFGYNTIYQTGTNTNEVLNLIAKGSGHLTLQAYNGVTGNVGIGTTGPAEKLHVNGSLRVEDGQLNTGTDNIRFMEGVRADDSSYEWAGFYSGSTRQGIILYDGQWSGANNLTNEFSLTAENGNLLTLNTDGNHVAIMPDGSGNVGVGTLSPGFKLHVNGDIHPDGKFVVQNGVDGGNSRGIWMWTAGDANWGIYMGQSGAGRSLSGGTAAAGGGFSAHAIRFRVNNASSQGFIFENSSEANLFSLRGDNGRATFRGGVLFDCPSCGSTSTVDGSSDWGDLTVQGRVLSTNSNLHLSPPGGSKVIINSTYRAAGGGTGTTGLDIEDGGIRMRKNYRWINRYGSTSGYGWGSQTWDLGNWDFCAVGHFGFRNTNSATDEDDDVQCAVYPYNHANSSESTTWDVYFTYQFNAKPRWYMYLEGYADTNATNCAASCMNFE